MHLIFNIEKSHAELIELTKKIRNLEAENTDLRRLVGETREHKLKIEAFQPLIIKLYKPEQIPDLRSFNKPISKADAARLGIKMATIQRFNQKIPKDDEIKELEEKLLVRSRIMAGYVWLDIVIKK